KIYSVYMKYVAPEDIIVYSIDEGFMDVTDYLKTYAISPRELTMKIILDVLNTTGITATAGIGTNLFLCKVAMDIVAKHIPADKNGVRIAQLDEMEFRRTLWDHKPLTDFWRVGAGYAKKLEQQGLYTMGDIARCSVENENILYGLFGKNTELLIDHAWGWEPCTIKDVKNYKPSSNSLSSGQVLQEPYESEKAKLVLKEMADFLVLDLVEKGLVTNQIVVTIGYDVENLSDKAKMKEYSGDVTVDGYGRKIPKQAHGSINLGSYTSSTKKILTAVSELYDKIINSKLLIRRLNITAANVIDEISASKYEECEQLDLFSDQDSVEEKHRNDTEEAEREKKMQKAMLSIKNKFGKNAILKGMNLEQGATAKDRNEQIGGHKA
ncbi:MAG: DNA methylase, partial [Ruminococcaceae bacterium]|nr:DNA methylase [Oscillospiraceae bacterium]